MSIYVIIGLKNNLPEPITIPVDKIYILSLENLETSDDRVEFVNDKNVLDFYQENDLENEESPVIFIDCMGKSKTYFDVMYLLNTVRFNNRSYYVHEPNRKLLLENYPLKEHFNPWTGEVPNETLSELEKESIVKMFNNLRKVTKSYLRAGFYNSTLQAIPEGWMMNFATPELFFIIEYYGLKPIAKDVHINMDFMHNSQYRKIVTQTLVAVVSNYFVKTGQIDPMSVKNWYSDEIW